MMEDTKTAKPRPVLDCVPAPKITDPFEIMAPLNNDKGSETYSAIFKVWRRVKDDGSAAGIAEFTCREFEGCKKFTAKVDEDGKVTVTSLGDGDDLEKLGEPGRARLKKLACDAYNSLVATMAKMPKDTIELCQRRLTHAEEIRRMRAL